MLDIAAASVIVKPRITDGLCCHNSSELKVRLGQEAMARQRRRWEDWMIIAEALDFGRSEIMRDLHTNAPTGRRYEKVMAEWLTMNGFKEIDKAVRCRLLECLLYRDAIEKWRALLTDGEQFRFNHPDAVLRKWKAATAAPDPNATPKPSAFTKLKEAHAELIEQHHRLEREIKAGGGDLWTPEDKPADIARVTVAKLSDYKVAQVMHEMGVMLKQRKAIRAMLREEQARRAEEKDHGNA